MSAIASAAQAAHSVAASFLAATQIKPGATIPAIGVKEEDPTNLNPLDLTGKNVGVPGAFTGTCSKQIPGYIEKYDEFKAKGVNAIYVVAVNDVFVMKGWKDNLAPGGTPIHFISDDRAEFVGSLGLVFDASERLGGPRSKRFVIVTDGNKATHVVVEDSPGVFTSTGAEVILAQL